MATTPPPGRSEHRTPASQDGLRANLDDWTRAERLRGAVADREAGNWQLDLKVQESSFDGVMLDGFERQCEFVVQIANGRTHRGQIAKASTTLIEFHSGGDLATRPTVIWIARSAIVSLTVANDSPMASAGTIPSSRTLGNHPDLHHQLSAISQERPMIQIWPVGSQQPLSGRLVFVGSDVLGMHTAAGFTYVALQSIIEAKLC